MLVDVCLLRLLVGHCRLFCSMNNKHILGEAGGVLLLVVEKDFAGEGQKVSHEPSPTGPVRAGGQVATHHTAGVF